MAGGWSCERNNGKLLEAEKEQELKESGVRTGVGVVHIAEDLREVYRTIWKIWKSDQGERRTGGLATGAEGGVLGKNKHPRFKERKKRQVVESSRETSRSAYICS